MVRVVFFVTGQQNGVATVVWVRRSMFVHNVIQLVPEGGSGWAMQSMHQSTGGVLQLQVIHVHHGELGGVVTNGTGSGVAGVHFEQAEGGTVLHENQTYVGVDWVGGKHVPREGGRRRGRGSAQREREQEVRRVQATDQYEKCGHRPRPGGVGGWGWWGWF